uniref:Uncharacterized protein n=1 Tax=Anguilla anguilla TaxID=7936 RepID=A0A0E9QD89_ANGAN
MCVYCLEWLAG